MFSLLTSSLGGGQATSSVFYLPGGKTGVDLASQYKSYSSLGGFFLQAAPTFLKAMGGLKLGLCSWFYSLLNKFKLAMKAMRSLQKSGFHPVWQGATCRIIFFSTKLSTVKWLNTTQNLLEEGEDQVCWVCGVFYMLTLFLFFCHLSSILNWFSELARILKVVFFWKKENSSVFLLSFFFFFSERKKTVLLGSL